MGKVIVGTTMSLDGFMNDRNGSVAKLYPDFAAMLESEVLKEAIRATGAVVMGRHTFDMADDPNWYADNYEFQVPIFVLTTHPPEEMPRQTEKLTFTFVTDGVESAIMQAKTAAGDKDVTVVGGAHIAQQILTLGLADEIQMSIIPVLLGEGLRFFDYRGAEPLELERVKVVQSPTRTDIVFRIVK
jgi:dihydrofolate reductase